MKIPGVLPMFNVIYKKYNQEHRKKELPKTFPEDAMNSTKASKAGNGDFPEE